MTRFKLYTYLSVCLFALAITLFFIGCTDQLVTENDPALQEVSVGKHDVSRGTLTDDPITTPRFKDASTFVVSEKKNWQEKTYEFSYATQQYKTVDGEKVAVSDFKISLTPYRPSKKGLNPDGAMWGLDIDVLDGATGYWVTGSYARVSDPTSVRRLQFVGCPSNAGITRCRFKILGAMTDDNVVNVYNSGLFTLRGQVDGAHISYENEPNGSFWLDPDDDDRGWVRAKWDPPTSSVDSWALDLVWSQDIEGGVQIGPHGIPGNERLQYFASSIVDGKTNLQYEDGTIVPKHDTRTGRAFGRMCGAVADDPDTEGVDESREAFPADTQILISQLNYGLNPRVRLQWHPQMLKEHNYPKQTYTYYLGDDLVNVTYAPVTCGQVCAKLNDC